MSNQSTTKNALSALSAIPGKCAFCAHRKECRATVGIMFGFCNADYTPDLDRLSAAVRLARRVDRWEKAWFTWDYADAVETCGGHAAKIKEYAVLLLDGGDYIIECLEECLEDLEGEETSEHYRCADRLLRAVRVFCADIN